MPGHDDLGAYVLGELNEEEDEAFRAHLARCPSCRNDLGWMSALSTSLGELGLPAERARPPGTRHLAD
ncbi:MAG TPA: zf-HC2 domain-containing protein [Amycolatopsis sp.]|uniref:anti-sigma factor family protein n=1 Tax=Amycolatopsis sp. TaxID=37632 RepID=UPI002B4698FF|nr:zf-HC2 domain-containing protein [Amycolatopsis sp.]HKS45030.1 zf-HC2 domain-containing protein [Amycolatopsis sp.]